MSSIVAARRGRILVVDDQRANVEMLVELLRSRVRPEAWETGSEINPMGKGMLLYAKPDVNRAVRAFVDRDLRPAVRGTVNLQIEILEAEEPLAAALAAATGGEVDPALRGRIEEAIGAGKARRTFDGRVRGLSKQEIVLWHGAQAATVSDADVEVATRSEAPDPVVDVEIQGTVLEAQSTIGDDGRLRITISLEQDTPDPAMRRVETAKAGTLEMPARSTMQVKADLWTANDKWAVAGERTSAEGKRRFLLVRPTVTGGAR